jgi:hypothetical protein
LPIFFEVEYQKNLIILNCSSIPKEEVEEGEKNGKIFQSTFE